MARLLGRPAAGPSRLRRRARRARRLKKGQKKCPPEIDTSEIVVDFQWHSPTDFQQHFPTTFHVSAVCSKGLSLFQRVCTGIVQWTFSGIFLWIYFCDFWCNILPRILCSRWRLQQARAGEERTSRTRAPKMLLYYYYHHHYYHHHHHNRSLVRVLVR